MTEKEYFGRKFFFSKAKPIRFSETLLLITCQRETVWMLGIHANMCQLLTSRNILPRYRCRMISDFHRQWKMDWNKDLKNLGHHSLILILNLESLYFIYKIFHLFLIDMQCIHSFNKQLLTLKKKKNSSRLCLAVEIHPVQLLLDHGAFFKIKYFTAISWKKVVITSWSCSKLNSHRYRASVLTGMQA